MEHPADGTCALCGLVPLAPSMGRSTRVVAHSPAMQALLGRVAKLARSDAPVVILGETGSGKEVVARALHANSERASRPFVAVNIAALPADLLESELFGHGKGAFTGAETARHGLLEEAAGGTLFLDEIGELPLPLQVKLLRALQSGEVRRVGENEAFEVDVRIVCATHRDLAQLVQQGRFREDLYFRLKVLTLRIPSLRERPEDIHPLACQFLAETHPGDRPLVGFTRRAELVLRAHTWPGNVRELENAVKHGAALASGPEIDVDDLPEEIVAPRPTSDVGPSRSPATPWDLRTLAEIERAHVLQVLDACNGSQIEAARVLGIGRNTLWRKLRSYGE